MNSTLIHPENIEQLKADGHAVLINELGCNEDWDKHQRKAEKAGKPWCIHCGRAVDLDTAWAIHRWVDKRYNTVAIEPGFEDGIETDLVLLGSTCGPKVMKSERNLNERFLIPAREVIA